MAARLLLVFLPVGYVSAGQQAIWSWRFFAVFALCFAVAVFLATRSKLPTPEETASGPKRRWLLPLAVGAAVALLTIGSDVVAPAAQARGLTTLHVRGWAALPFYTYGAILLTVVFHFLPIALVAWLAQQVRGRARAALVGVGVLAVAFSEDAGYFLGSRSFATVDALRHVLSVLANGTEAVFIYRFGFLAGLAQRSATYFLWHFAWPLLLTGGHP
ncbi:MAG TPA: hypothetical protein VF756_14230 [Thermoanaerobaculia bacterium]